MDNVLEVVDLYKSFNPGKDNQVDVLKGVNITMKKGDFFSLMGPSGSGKSTLLNIVGGLIESTSGSVSVLGSELESLSDNKLTELRGQKIGWVFQSFGLIENLTALENVLVPMNLQGTVGKEAEDRAMILLDRVGLLDRANHFPDDLSGGQQQRVAIARALGNNPALLLADEPTGNLDTKTGLEIINLFQEIAKEGRTVLMVSHDVKLAHASQHVFILQQGQLIEEAVA